MHAENGIIISNQCIASDTYQMILQSNISETMEAGQFVNIRMDGYMLRRPISICSIEQQRFTIIYKVVGDGTKALSKLQPQQQLDIFGPLGHGFPIDDRLDEVLLIGGGVGVPPLYEVAKRFCALHKKVVVVLGFNDKASVFYEQEFTALGANVYIATMDGSYGTKGTVVDAIQAHTIAIDTIYTCGPRPMLKALEKRYTKGYMSFEARMACGMGACMACVAKDKKEEGLYHRICKEGPVFPIGKVEF